MTIMKRAGLLIAGVFLSGAAQAATVTVANGVKQSMLYSGQLPPEVIFYNNRANSLYTDNGFVWSNPSAYGDDCQSGGSVNLYWLDNQYNHVSCYGGTFLRQDGGRFNVSSIKVDAADLRVQAPTTESPAGQEKILRFGWDLRESDYDAELAAAGIDTNDRAAVRAFMDVKRAEADKRVADYRAWMDSSTKVTNPAENFLAVGYRDGIEVARHAFSDTNGLTNISLTGFDDITSLSLSPLGGPYLWDHYNSDNGYLTALAPGQLWCDHACENFRIFGFDFSLGGGQGVTPVPLPGGVWTLGLALGLLGWSARRRS